MKTLAVLLVLVFSLPPIVHAQADSAKIPVYVDISQNNLALGERLAFRVKETLRRSAEFRLVDADSPEKLSLFIMSIAWDSDHPSTGIIVDVAWVLDSQSRSWAVAGKSFRLQQYLTRTVGICTDDNLDTMSETIVARTDKLIDQLRQLLAP